jgi:hypothetical protein
MTTVENIKKHFITIVMSILLLTFTIILIVCAVKKDSCGCKKETYSKNGFFMIPSWGPTSYPTSNPTSYPTSNNNNHYKLIKNIKEKYESLCKTCPSKRNGKPLIFPGVGS